MNLCVETVDLELLALILQPNQNDKLNFLIEIKIASSNIVFHDKYENYGELDPDYRVLCGTTLNFSQSIFWAFFFCRKRSHVITMQNISNTKTSYALHTCFNFLVSVTIIFWINRDSFLHEFRVHESSCVSKSSKYDLFCRRPSLKCLLKRWKMSKFY